MKTGAPAQVRQVFAEAVPGLTLYGPDASAIVVTAFKQLERYARRDGVQFSPAVQRVLDVAAATAADASGHGRQASRGHDDVLLAADLEQSEAWISTAEVAMCLGLSPRQCSRLVRAGVLGPRRRHKGHYRVARVEVTAYAAQRRQEGSTDEVARNP